MKFKVRFEKPLVVDAIQWNGNNKKEMQEFCDYEMEFDGNICIVYFYDGKAVLEPGDWLVCNDGDWYRVRDSLFRKIFKKLEGNDG